jgi:hypothetical protein
MNDSDKPTKRALYRLKSETRGNAEHLLYAANLTLLEQEILIKHDLDGIDIESVCCSLQYWHYDRFISYSHCLRLRKKALQKLATFFEYNHLHRRKTDPDQTPSLF